MSTTDNILLHRSISRLQIVSAELRAGVSSHDLPDAEKMSTPCFSFPDTITIMHILA
jgi:hypothetical protein